MFGAIEVRMVSREHERVNSMPSFPMPGWLLFDPRILHLFTLSCSFCPSARTGRQYSGRGPGFHGISSKTVVEGLHRRMCFCLHPILEPVDRTQLAAGCMVSNQMVKPTRAAVVEPV